MAANLEKLGYGLLKITSTGAGAATLAGAGEAVGGIVLTGLATVGGAASGRTCGSSCCRRLRPV